MRMKKLIISVATLAGVAVFTACSNDDTVFDGFAVETPSPDGPTYTMAIEAVKGGEATTRALSVGSGGTTLDATWATTDNIYVKKGSDWSSTALSPDAAGTSATLRGTLSGITIAAGDVLTLQFPKSGSPTYTGQTGTLADIAANFDYATASVKVKSVTSAGNIIPDVTTTTFTNQQAIVKFTLKDASGNALPSNPTALTVNDGTTTIALTDIPAATYTTNGNGVLYVAFPATGSSVTVKLSTVVGSDFYACEKSGITFANGKYYIVSANMAKKPATDLSMVDCAGATRANQWTANCYMVHEAGPYKLPLVYGNAIKEGVANTAAYTGIENTYTTATFPNHAGNAINAPWITKSTSGEGVNKGMGITVASAELLWQDAVGLITEVGIDGDYLTLTVGKDAATQQGNALVAAKDGSGNIVWSWHIWVTTETFASLTTVSTGNHDYQVTPVNLGWVPTGGDGKQGYNTYYQWGRKDAFIPGTGSANTNRTVYNISNSTVTGLTYTTSTTAKIADNIKNPTTHYYNTSTCGPCDTQYYNMWDAQQTGTNNIATATKKTVYDPCPAGFCVPTGNLYYFMGNGNSRSMSTWDGTNKGATWDNSVVANSITGTALFFPASGDRISSSGTLVYVGSHGYCWSTSPSSDSKVRYMYFNSNFWYWNKYYRAYGFSVRAVAE